MASVWRTLRFAGFTLLEYLRSGRVLVELIVAAGFAYIFLLRWQTDASYFFTATGAFVPGLMLYTMSASIGLGDRPQGYVLLARRLGRAGYLGGIFLSALTVVTGTYGLVCIATALINPPSDLGLGGWLLGTLPLLLNAALLAALLLLLSPLVLPTGWRLFVLALIALAFSGNFISGAVREQFEMQLPIGYTLLTSVQTILSWPLVPAFSGFALGVTRDYSGSAPIILLAQLSLLAALLALSIYAFERRDLIFSSG